MLFRSRKIMTMIETSDNPQVIAGYINSIIVKTYNECKKCADIDRDKQANYKDDYSLIMASWDYSLKYLEKRNNELVKRFGVTSVNEIKEEVKEVVETQEIPEVPPVESNENLTPLKKCNVVRYIPTQVNPIWKYGLCETYVGYHFTYRGMPLQAYTTGGWCKDNVTTTIFIVDPVIGLPITHYDGMLSDIEEVLAGVFIKYLQTIENNKEVIVQIARAFEDLKRQTNNMTA